MNGRAGRTDFTFVDVEARDRAAFDDGRPMPTRAERESLQPRDGVELLIASAGSGDAAGISFGAVVVAEVMEVLEGGGYRGWVEEAPASGPGPRVDEVIEFGPEHVSAIAKYWSFLEESKIVVGIKVHVLRLRPSLVYRENRDSGGTPGGGRSSATSRIQSSTGTTTKTRCCPRCLPTSWRAGQM